METTNQTSASSQDNQADSSKTHSHDHEDHIFNSGHDHGPGEKCTVIKCQYNIEFNQFSMGGWDFYSSDYPMFSTTQLDQVSDVVGTMSMPEVFYGFNRLYVTNPAKNILLEFAPVEALSLSSFAKREMLNNKNTSQQSDGQTLEQQMESLSLNLKSEEIPLNKIDFIPKNIEVKDAHFWKNKDMSKVKDFKQIEVISDWTYSSPYKGNLRYISNHIDRLKSETSLELKSESQGEIKIEQTEDAIPLDKLGRDNPILHFGEIFLYEDDLGDQGYCRSQVRFRIMKDCFYVLVRYYLRVDEVLVRVFDTRIYHDFSQNYIHREFSYKQSTYEELRAKEFKLNSDWSLSKSQSDEVYPYLDLKFKKLDKVFF